MKDYQEHVRLLRLIEDGVFDSIDEGGDVVIDVLDPPGCGCTDCLTGYSQPMSKMEYEQLGYPSRLYRMTKSSVEYFKDARL